MSAMSTSPLLFYGDFAEKLIKGRDTLGKQPHWPYDVVNLDYFGGFIYSNF